MLSSFLCDHVVMYVATSVSDKQAASIFRVQMLT